MKRTNWTKRLLLLSFLSLTLAFSACKKDDPPTNTDHLTGSLWKMTAITIDPAFPIFDVNGNITGYTNDLFSQLSPCAKDDTYKYNSDFTMKTDEGASKCDSGDPQSTAGIWSFNTDETVLSTTSDGFTQVSTIMELTSEVLKLKYSQPVGPTTYTFNITFSH